MVIAIIGILSAISIFALQGSRESARDGRRKADLEAIRSALELFKSDNGFYPWDTTNCTSGNASTCFASYLVPNYIPAVPADSTAGRVYSVTVQSCVEVPPAGSGIYECPKYVLCAGLETDTVADSVCTTYSNNCGTGITCSHSARNP